MSTPASPPLPRRETLPQRFPLCKVVRMMRLQTSDLKDGTQPSALQRIMVRMAASKTTRQHTLMALACSNLSKLIVRYLNSSGTSIIRYIDWFSTESIRRPEALVYDRFGEWLLCVGYDGSLHLIPQLALLAPDIRSAAQVHEQPRYNGQKLKKREIISTPPNSRLAGKVTCCCWWSTYSGRDLAVVGTKDGGIYFLELPSGVTRQLVQANGPVDRLEIVEDAGESRQGMFVQAGSHFTLRLDESLIDEPTSMFQEAPPPPKLRSADAFGQTSMLRIQSVRGMAVVGVHDVYKTSRLQIFTPDLAAHPLYVHQLVPGVAGFLLTDNLIFTVSGGKTTRITILSNLLSRTSMDANPESTQRSLGRSIIQELTLPANERVVGIFDNSMRSDIGSDAGSVPHCTVVTTNGIYDVKLDQHPEQIFLKKLDGGGNPESLAHTLRLDKNRLYEIGIRALVEKGEYARAISVCAHAQVQHEHVIPLFVKSGQTSLIAVYLQSYLENTAALRTASRKLLADILLLCYMQTLLLDASYTDHVDEDMVGDPGSDDIVLGEEVSARLNSSKTVWRSCAEFLTRNNDYDFDAALRAMMVSGRFALLFEAAKAKGGGQLPKLLNKIADEQIIPFRPGLLHFFIDNGYSDAICSCREGLLLRYMSPNSAVRLLASRPLALEDCMNYAAANLDSLDVAHLRILANYFDPSRPLISEMFSLGYLPNNPDVKVGQVLEIYIRVMLALASNDESYLGEDAWCLRAVEMLAETTVEAMKDILDPKSRPSSPAPMTGQYEPTTKGRPLSPSFTLGTSRTRTLSNCSNYSNASTQGLLPSFSFIDGGDTESSWQVPSLPSITGKLGGEERSSLAAFQALRTLHASYDQSKILQHCLRWENEEAAAYVLAIHGELAKSFYYRMAALESHVVRRKTSGQPCEAYELARHLANEVPAFLVAIRKAKHRPSSNTSDAAIYSVLDRTMEFWAKHGLPPAELEDLLSKHIDDVTTAVVRIVYDALEPGSAEGRKPMLLNLSSTFYATLHRLTAQTGPQGKSRTSKANEVVNGVDVSEQHLWSEILDNLSKDLKARLQITSKISKPGDFSFTCGHSYPKRMVSESLVPALRKRLQALPAPLPTTAGLLASEYGKDSIAASCPICVFNMARRFQPVDNSDIPLWRVPEGY